MKPQTRIALDMSAWLWNSLLTGKDTENGHEVIHEGKPKWINSHHHGYDILVPRIVDLLNEYSLTPIDMIMVFEGKNSKSKRLMIDPGYKQGRDHPADAYTEFLTLKDRIRTLFLELGAQAMQQDYCEGDDTLAWLAENTEDDLIIATFDNDIAVLNGFNRYCAQIRVWINGQEGGNKYGMFDHDLITTYKALVGDSTDKIKGCIGFGPSKFEAFCNQYGFDGLRELHNMLRDANLSPLAEMAQSGQHKLVAMIYDQAVAVQKSFDMAKLYPEWVNTKAYPIEWQAGMVRQLRPDDREPGLKKWYGRARLVTGDTFDAAFAWMQPYIAESREVALDIETSSTEESDAWLERQGNPDGVDVFGSTLTGLGLTFGRNNQYTFYFSVDHADTVNCTKAQIKAVIELVKCPIVIQNMAFETVVIHNELGPLHGYNPQTFDRT